jgi:hypothetical protein
VDPGLDRADRALKDSSARLNARQARTPNTAGGQASQLEPLIEWLKAARNSLKAYGKYLAADVGETLKKEEVDALHKMLRMLRDDLDKHVLDQDSALNRNSPEAYQGVIETSKQMKAAYRQLLNDVVPYRGLVTEFAGRPFGGTTDPAKIRQSLRDQNLDSQSIRDKFAEYQETTMVFLEELVRLLKEPK